MGLEALVRGWVSRAQPQALPDNDRGVLRLARYGEGYMVPLIRKQHALADEGSYFVANNGQTGIVGPLIPAAFSNINPAVVMIVTNSDGISNANAKRIHLDWAHFIVTVAGVAAASATFVNFAWTIGQGDRYASGGTDISSLIVNPNMDVSTRSSVAKVRFGAITTTAVDGSLRTVVGQRQLRVTNTATAICVAQDDLLMTFGNVEPAVSGIVDLTTAKIVAYRDLFQLPPIVIGPGQCAQLHMWSPGAALTTGITMLPELGWWER